MRRTWNGGDILWPITACTALALFGDSAMYAILPSQFERFGIVVVQVGWLLSINRLVRLPLNVPSGWLMRRFGPKWPLVVGLGLGAISTLGFGLFRSFWPLLAFRGLWGIAWALIVVASYGFVFASADPGIRGQATGIYTSFARFGGALGAIIGGLLLDALGTAPAMFALASCGGGAVLIALLLPNPRIPSGNVLALTGSRPHLRPSTWLRSLRQANPSLWLISLLNLSHLLVFSGIFYSTFGLYLRTSIGERIPLGGIAVGVASMTGILLFVRNIFSLVSNPLFGALSDRTGKRILAIVYAEGVGTFSLLLLAIDSSPVIVAIGILVASVSFGLTPALLLAWLGDITEGRSGTAIGGFQTAGDLGSGLGPLVAYPLVAWLGIRGTYAVAAGVALLATLLILVKSGSLSQQTSGRTR